MAPYEFSCTARTRTTALVVALVWLAIFAAILFLNASLVLMTVLMLFTAPALYDLISNRPSGMRLDADGLHWFTGKRTGDITWAKIEYLRLDTRLDFSVRLSAVLVSGRRIRLPMEVMSDVTELESELTKRDIPFRRHHFSLVG